MSDLFLATALLGTIIGGGISIILCWKSDNFALVMIPLIIGIGAISIPSLILQDAETSFETRLILTEFDKLDCSDKADLILKNHLDGNKTRVSKLLPLFSNAGCKFDITSQLVLESSK